MFQERWAISDSETSFAHALEEQGFILAKGDRRGIVAVDHEGEAYAITRWVGVKTKQVRSRLGKPDNLPSVAEARNIAAELVAIRLKELEREQEQKAQQEKETKAQEITSRRTAQKQDLLQLQMRQKERERKAEQQTASRNEIRTELQKDIRWLETPFKNASEDKTPENRRRRKRNREIPDHEPEP